MAYTKQTNDRRSKNQNRIESKLENNFSITGSFVAAAGGAVLSFNISSSSLHTIFTF